jgi:hypothetical protein
VRGAGDKHRVTSFSSAICSIAAMNPVRETLDSVSTERPIQCGTDRPDKLKLEGCGCDPRVIADDYEG